jgi:glutamate synthase (NADPH/NADH) large chain
MRLQPGKMFLVDTAQGRIVSDEEIKSELAAEHPYREWLDSQQFHLDELPRATAPHRPRACASRPSATPRGAQPAGRADGATGASRSARWAPTPGRRALGQAADAVRLLPAAVRPGDQPARPIREEVVTSLQATIGPEADLLNPVPESCHQIVLPQPILRNHGWPSWSTSTPTTRSAPQARHALGGHPLSVSGRKGGEVAPRTRRHPGRGVEGDRGRRPSS